MLGMATILFVGCLGGIGIVPDAYYKFEALTFGLAVALAIQVNVRDFHPFKIETIDGSCRSHVVVRHSIINEPSTHHKQLWSPRFEIITNREDSWWMSSGFCINTSRPRSRVFIDNIQPVSNLTCGIISFRRRDYRKFIECAYDRHRIWKHTTDKITTKCPKAYRPQTRPVTEFNGSSTEQIVRISRYFENTTYLSVLFRRTRVSPSHHQLTIP